MKLEDRLGKHGFFTNIYLKAANAIEAENEAMATLRKNPTLRTAVRNAEDDPPMMFADEITEISNYDELESKEQGLIWYLEDEK